MKAVTKADRPIQTGFCPVCAARARHEEALIDALQTARLALTAHDGQRDWRLRDARVKAALDEALRLMGAQR